MTFPERFKRVLADLIEPPLCPVCTAGVFPEGRDPRRAYAVGAAARLSVASEIARNVLGWEMPWRLHHVVHMVPVPGESGVWRMLLDAGGFRGAANLPPGWPCEAYEGLCRGIALDVAMAAPPPGGTREVLEAALLEGMRGTDLHVCGRSTDPAVARVVREFGGR